MLRAADISTGAMSARQYRKREVLMDDILVHAKSMDRLKQIKVIEALKNSGLTLNKDKCVFGAETVPFLGSAMIRCDTVAENSNWHRET